MRRYELMFIIRPDVPEEEREKLITQMEGVVTGAGGTLQKTEKIGLRRLAYRVSRQREGYYVLFTMEGSGDTIKEFERRMKVTDAVIKYLTVRTDEVLKRVEKLKAHRAQADSRRGQSRPKPAAPQPPLPAPEAAEA